MTALARVSPTGKLSVEEVGVDVAVGPMNRKPDLDWVVTVRLPVIATAFGGMPFVLATWKLRGVPLTNLPLMPPVPNSAVHDPDRVDRGVGCGCRDRHVTYPVFVSVFVPSRFVTVSETVQVPGLNVWLGFWRVDVPPSPKVHAQVAGVPVDASVNWTLSGPSPVSGVPLNTAVGAIGQIEPAQPWR